jgi:glycosyltransferase involved in cell wall biosynthesis
MNPTYRIAWVGKKTPFCGNVTYCREIVRGLSERGHEVQFIHFSEDSSGDDHEVVIPYLYKSQMYTIPALNSVKVLTEALQEFQPDILHASLPISAMDFNLPDICHKLGIPYVATFHNAFDRRPSFFSGTSYLSYQFYAPNLVEADRVIIFSNIHKQLLLHVGCSAEQVAIVPNAIDTQKFAPGPSAFRTRYPDKLIVTYMGRIAPEKGIDDLLKVWQRLELTDAQLVLVGEGSQRQLLQSLFSEVPNVTWTGFLGEAERLDVLRGSDIFVLPSQVEGLSIAMLEAMACGRPVVGVNAGGVAETVDASVGQLAKSADPADFAEAIEALFARDVEAVGRAARLHAVDNFAWSRVFEDLCVVYGEVTGRSSFVQPRKDPTGH